MTAKRFFCSEKKIKQEDNVHDLSWQVPPNKVSVYDRTSVYERMFDQYNNWKLSFNIKGILEH